MKKFLISILSLIFILTAHAQTAEDWYQYNGDSDGRHAFAFRFPTDWEVRTEGDKIQTFRSKTDKEVLVTVEEFEAQTYDQVINYFSTDDNPMLSVEDIVIEGHANLHAKKAIYQNSTYLFVKRASLILSINYQEDEISAQIANSLTFNDQWQQYFDFTEGYTFLFPSKFKVNALSSGVQITDDAIFGDINFQVNKFADIALEKAPKELENADFISQKSVPFHGIEKAISATFEDDELLKDFKLIFVSREQNTYSLTGPNLIQNSPHLDYYEQFIIEMLESFEFFDLDGEYHSYIYFPDIRDNHLNVQAINSLKSESVIDGYPDGKFRPDSAINRAELAKLIVSTQANPKLENYSNCFTDIKEEWYAPYVCYAKEKNWVVGYDDGKFRPESNINRVEALRIILEALHQELTSEEQDLPDDIHPEAWYWKYFAYAQENSLLDTQHVQENNYLPAQDISRKEVAETIFRSLQ
ncbi:S-layer homology domain-containing protein [Candidatus Gracilibacteria bacterium]|nr:S-layer homology domain-containing protein [Candidatus Gracilibacteria bacterium]